jgi:hypothetical protein
MMPPLPIAKKRLPRHHAIVKHAATQRPLSLTLSPEYRDEGTGRRAAEITCRRNTKTCPTESAAANRPRRECC